MNMETEAFLMSIKFPITIGYGMTECAPLISFTPDNEFKAGSCGRFLSEFIQVKIDSPDPEHVAGEILVHGEHVMMGYYKNEEETRKVLDEKGGSIRATSPRWIRTARFTSAAARKP